MDYTNGLRNLLIFEALHPEQPSQLAEILVFAGNKRLIKLKITLPAARRIKKYTMIFWIMLTFYWINILPT